MNTEKWYVYLQNITRIIKVNAMFEINSILYLYKSKHFFTLNSEEEKIIFNQN